MGVGERPFNCESVRERQERERKGSRKRETGTEGQNLPCIDLPGSVSFRAAGKVHSQPLRTSSVPSPGLCALQISALLLFPTTSGGSCCHYAHFTDKGSEAETIGNLLRLTQL